MTPIEQQACWAQAQDVLLSQPRPQLSYLLNGMTLPVQQDLAGQACDPGLQASEAHEMVPLQGRDRQAETQRSPLTNEERQSSDN